MRDVAAAVMVVVVATAIALLEQRRDEANAGRGMQIGKESRGNVNSQAGERRCDAMRRMRRRGLQSQMQSRLENSIRKRRNLESSRLSFLFRSFFPE